MDEEDGSGGVDIAETSSATTSVVRAHSVVLLFQVVYAHMGWSQMVTEWRLVPHVLFPVLAIPRRGPPPITSKRITWQRVGMLDGWDPATAVQFFGYQ